MKADDDVPRLAIAFWSLVCILLGHDWIPVFEEPFRACRRCAAFERWP